MKPFSIEFIESALQTPLTEVAYSRARALIPYSFQSISGGHVLPVNRDYLPLGLTKHVGIVDYNSPKYFSLRISSKSLDRSNLLHNDYLFNDGCSPLSGPNRNRYEYLFRLWHSLQPQGLLLPDNFLATLEKASTKYATKFRLAMNGARSW